MREKLANVYLAKYRFVLKPFDFIKLSTYAGSSLRKDFSPVFKQLTCLNPDEQCKKCNMKENCPYYVCFETPEGVMDPEYKRYQTPPKPFIFESPLKRKTFYSKNEELYFDLSLFGKALEYFPYFAKTVNRLGEMGIGRNRGKFLVKKIYPFDLQINSFAEEFDINSLKEGNFKDARTNLGLLYELYAKEVNELSQVSVSIITPLRMKRIGSDNWRFYFRTLIRNILTRIANIGYAYCGYDEFLHFPEIIYNAGSVRTVKEELVWEDWRHPARRNENQKLKLGGFVGELVYRGKLTEYWPILRLGELIHIGKNTSFGLGRILVEKVEPESVEQ